MRIIDSLVFETHCNQGVIWNFFDGVLSIATLSGQDSKERGAIDGGAIDDCVACCFGVVQYFSDRNSAPSKPWKRTRLDCYAMSSEDVLIALPAFFSKIDRQRDLGLVALPHIEAVVVGALMMKQAVPTHHHGEVRILVFHQVGQVPETKEQGRLLIGFGHRIRIED